MPVSKNKTRAKPGDGMSIINASTQIDLVAVDALSEHPRNPNQGDVWSIQSSIEANGFYGAVVAQKSSGHILAGNHRYRAAKEAGAASIPVIWLDVDDRQALKILLADNRTAELAHRDEEALATLLQELSADEDLLGTGYDAEAVDKLLRDVDIELVDPFFGGRKDKEKNTYTRAKYSEDMLYFELAVPIIEAKDFRPAILSLVGEWPSVTMRQIKQK